MRLFATGIIPVYDVPVFELVAMQTLSHGEWFDKIQSIVEKFESALRLDDEDGEPEPADGGGEKGGR